MLHLRNIGLALTGIVANRAHLRIRLLILLTGLCAVPHAVAAPATACPATAPVALQVIGSGGPIAEGDRAGTSYVLRIDGVPRVLIDVGAGSFLRLGQAGVTLRALDAIIVTHFHADHVGDLIGILKSGSFEDRGDPLPIFGPAGGGRFPGLKTFLERELSPIGGSYGYLGGYLDGSEDKARLVPGEIITGGGRAPSVVRTLAHGVKLTFVPVHHGEVPAFGLVIEVGNKTIVLGGDQSRFSEDFAKRLAGRRPDLFVAHHVVPEGPGQPLGLHRNPASIGILAQEMRAHRMILSHNMRRSLVRLDEGMAAIRKAYAGPVTVASDLDCFIP